MTWTPMTQLTIAALAGIAVAAPLLAAPTPSVALRGAQYTEPVFATTLSVDLRALPHPKRWQPGDPVKEVPRRHRRKAIEPPAPAPRLDPLLKKQSDRLARAAQRAAVTAGLNFAGQGFTGVNPPDTVGDVGLNYYIQAINHGSEGSVCTVYNKTNGAVVAGPFTMKSIHADDVTGGGDPIVLYDEAADRWLLSEFASGANELHVYIAQSSDPVAGGWHHYTFTTPNFPDYPKYGAWPDAYYVTSNESSPTYYALDRSRMLLGLSATMQRFTTTSLSAFSFQALTPADVDGPAPPAGRRHIAMRHRDDEAHNPGSNNPTEDYLELFEFNVDWATPANSTMVKTSDIAISEFDSHLNGYTVFEAITQPDGGALLDPLREPVMWRLQYRNFGSHESLCGSFTTDVDGTDHAGIRWFELRRSGGGWALHDEGTWAPDAHSRWMPSAALDESGNLGLAYSVSSSSVYPGLRYTGRLAGDPAGTLTAPETTIAAGSAANGSNRYGDYASMSVDPASGCTFWFTGQYNAASTWSTRVASFGFDTCGCTAAPVPVALAATPDGANRIAVSWSAAAGADNYHIYRALGACPQTAYQRILSHHAGTSFVDTNASGGVTYSYRVTSYKASETCESAPSTCAEAMTTGPCSVAPAFAGVGSVQSADTEPCAMQVTWPPAVSYCGGAVVYSVYRSTLPAVPAAASNLVAACVGSTSIVDRAVVTGVEFYYLVRAEDLGGTGSGPCAGGAVESNTVTRSGVARGGSALLLNDDIESGSGGWSTSTGPLDTGTTPWALSTTTSASPTHAWFCSDEAAIKDQRLQFSSALAIPSGCPSQLLFAHHYDLEGGFDGGVLEYSTDNGTSWFDILAGNGAGVPANANRFTSGAYNSIISTNWDSPIGGQAAWSGSSGSFNTTSVDLDDMAGLSILLRWRAVCDKSVSAVGWYIDDVTVENCIPCQQGGYPAWRSMIGWSGTGDLALDDNADGVWNMEAYFHGVNPTGALGAAEQARLPSVGGDSTSVLYRFNISTNPSMVAGFSIYTNPSLTTGDWRVVHPPPTPAPDGSVELRTLLDEIPGQLFYRIGITE